MHHWSFESIITHSIVAGRCVRVSFNWLLNYVSASICATSSQRTQCVSLGWLSEWNVGTCICMYVCNASSSFRCGLFVNEIFRALNAAPARNRMRFPSNRVFSIFFLSIQSLCFFRFIAGFLFQSHLSILLCTHGNRLYTTLLTCLLKRFFGNTPSQWWR